MYRSLYVPFHLSTLKWFHLEWFNTADMQHRRTGHTASLLTNGNVLVTGGWEDENTVSKTAEL
jgi:hypothetical protein